MKITAITKFKLGIIQEAFEKTSKNQSWLSKNTGISAQQIGRILNLKYRASEYQTLKIQKAFGDIGYFLDVEGIYPDNFTPIKRGVKFSQTKDVSLDFLPIGNMDFEAEKINDYLELYNVLEGLNPRERYVIEEKFFKERKLKEIGRDLNVGKERIRQIEAKAMRKIRHPKNLEFLKQINK